ncbi:MAG: DUF5107 domain-containing protein [Planctomycetota bacterium]
MAATRVRIWEDEIALETLALDAHNRHPQFEDVYGTWAFPYPIADLVGDRHRRIEKYLAVHIENEFLHLVAFPHFGGRIYSCRDKASGHDIFHSVERVAIAFLPTGSAGGTYSGTGVEISFPDHHSLTNTRKREYLTRRLADGSAEIVMGELELRHRMRWEVHLALSPGVAAVRQEVRVFNRTFFPARGRYWGNASMTCESPRFECIFPEKEGWEHGGEYGVASWPVYDGVDQRLPNNVPIPVGVEMKDVRDGFYAYYDHDRSFGMVHWAPPDECPGKKYWTWGSSRHAIQRAHNFADGKIYMEMQSGRCEDQEAFELFAPMRFARWREVWYPVRGTEGLRAASADLAANFSFHVSGERIAGVRALVWPTRDLGRCEIVVVEERTGRRLGTAAVAARAQELVTAELAFARPVEKSVALRIVLTSGGERVLDHLSSPDSALSPLVPAASPCAVPYLGPGVFGAPDNAADRACVFPAERRVETADEAFADAMKFMLYLRRTWSQIEGRFRGVLEKDSSHAEARRWLGVLALRRGLAKEAAEHLEPACERQPGDGLARFYRGLARLGEGDEWEARHDLLLAARLGEADLAFHLLGRLAMAEGKWEEASERFSLSLAHNEENVLSRVYRALALARRGRKREALTELGGVEEVFPTEAAGRVARILVSAGTLAGALRTAQGRILAKQLRRDIQAYLELALDLAAVGFLAEAVDLLAEAKRECRGTPGAGLADLYRGWLLHRLGRKASARAAFRAASKADRTYAFPFRLEEEAILKTALEYDERDGTVWQYVAILRGAQGRFEEARGAWERAIQAGLEDAVAYYGLGKVVEKIFGERDEAGKLYEKALALDENDTHARAALLDLAEARKDLGAQRRLLAHPSVRRSALLFRLANFHLRAGEIDEAVKIMTEVASFPNSGQEQEPLHEEALVARAMRSMRGGDFEAALQDLERALATPANLGFTVKVRAAQPRVRYLLGQALRRLGREEEAKREWQKGLEEQEFPLWLRGLGWDYGVWTGRYWQARILQELGRHAEADVYLDGLREHAMTRIGCAVDERGRRELWSLASRGKARAPVEGVSTRSDYLEKE